jgi:hypothetical protein
MNRFLNASFERRNRRERQVQQRTASRNIEVGSASAAKTIIGDLKSLLLHLGIPARHGELILLAAQFEIIARDFRGETDEHIEAVGFGRGSLRVGSFHGTAHPAE